MRILANENIAGAVVEALRSEGHDVVWMRARSPGESDRSVLELAQREERILITFDKDFGELAFHAHLPASCGFILFRISTPSPEDTMRAILASLKAQTDWTGYFSVVEQDRIRMTRLP